MSTPRLSDEAAAAWARVSILLGDGDVEAATAEALTASGLTDWAAFGDYMRFSGPAVYASIHLPAGWVWVEPKQRRVLLADSVMDEFAMRSALSKFTRTVTAMMDAPGFRSISVENWRELRPLRPSR